jgi:hypothetical protein
VKEVAAIALLSVATIGGIHLIIRYLGHDPEAEQVKYPHGPTTDLGWLPIPKPKQTIFKCWTLLKKSPVSRRSVYLCTGKCDG